jgi:N-acetylglucosamine malate deacetylase 1
MTIVVVAAHPDDVELLCAGTLARLSQAGHQVRLAHLTYGDKGGRGDPEGLAATRDQEARAAAALLNATTCGRICGDLELYPNAEFATAVAGLVAGEDVEAVLTHHPDDYHPDHRITSQLVLEAVRQRSLLPRVWFMDSVGGAHFVPTRLVDVTGTIETKKRMLRCHRSQVAWMTTARHTDMEYMIEWTGRWRGLQAGTDYAEGFAPAISSADWFADQVAGIAADQRTDGGHP